MADVISSGRRSATAWRAAFVPMLAIWLAACVSDTISIPPVEPQQVELPGAPPPAPGSALDREHKRILAGFGGEYRAPRMQALLSDIAERLRLVSDRPSERYTVTILNSPSVNAFALPNGYVYLTRGVLALANDTAEIASVIAHEIAHVTARHALERAELESRSVLVSRVMTEVLENPGASQFMRDQSRVALASFSRQQEIDADEIGVRSIAKAGFEAHGAARFLLALERSSRLRGAIDDKITPEKTDILATHPATPERLAKVVLVARQFGAPGLGEANRMRWLEALSGVAYGEDPAQGVVRGPKFLHPRLHFAFDAPEGFVLENTPQAILGVTAGASEALRLDSNRTEPALALTDLLLTNPIEGLSVSDIRDLRIDGLAAATGLARGPEWTFRVVLIRVGDYVYRIIYAAQALSAETDARFLDSAKSFRRLSDAEAKTIKPQRIALVQAKTGERAEDLVAAHMANVPQALERFLVLNGLAAEDPLVPGTQYKIVSGT